MPSPCSGKCRVPPLSKRGSNLDAKWCGLSVTILAQDRPEGGSKVEQSARLKFGQIVQIVHGIHRVKLKSLSPQV